MIPAPFDRTLDEFLSGTGELDVDRIFAKDFRRVLDEFAIAAPDDLIPRGPSWPSVVSPMLHYRQVPAGVMLYDGDQPIGGYLSCDLSLDERHRGKGLGAEIVIERCLLDGENPVLHLDEAAYSPAGLAAHLAAWRRVRRDHAETALRISRTERWT